MKKYKTTYEKEGVVVIPNVFTEEEMDTLKTEAYKVTGGEIKDAGYPHVPEEYKNGKRTLVFFPALANKYIDNIRTDERLVKIVKYFLGDDVKQVNNQIYFREPGDGDQFAWHQDIRFRTPRDRFPGIEEGYLQTIICVDDIDDNGAIEFIPQSHDKEEPQDNDLRNFIRDGREGVKYKAKKGSVILWHVLTVHGSEPNVSDKSRMTYMSGFAKASNCLDYPYYLRDGKVLSLVPSHIP